MWAGNTRVGRHAAHGPGMKTCSQSAATLRLPCDVGMCSLQISFSSHCMMDGELGRRRMQTNLLPRILPCSARSISPLPHADLFTDIVGPYVPALSNCIAFTISGSSPNIPNWEHGRLIIFSGLSSHPTTTAHHQLRPTASKAASVVTPEPLNPGISS